MLMKLCRHNCMPDLKKYCQILPTMILQRIIFKVHKLFSLQFLKGSQYVKAEIGKTEIGKWRLIGKAGEWQQKKLV